MPVIDCIGSGGLTCMPVALVQIWKKLWNPTFIGKNFLQAALEESGVTTQLLLQL